MARGEEEEDEIETMKVRRCLILKDNQVLFVNATAMKISQFFRCYKNHTLGY